MASNFFKKWKEKRKRAAMERQSWKPKGILRIFNILWVTAVSAIKIALGAAATVLCILVVCGLVFVGLLGTYLQEDIIPAAEGFSLDDYFLDQTSFVKYVDADGNIQQLQEIYASTDSQWAELKDIPEDLIHAAVAIEDKRFYEHQGVDWITTIKACANMFFGSSSTAGGSTITQQLIKNMTKENSVTVQRKVMEIFKAQLAERDYDKDTIMEWYLNYIYLGQGCQGVKSAAATYFGKELETLTTAECASLISITNNPSLFDPYNVDPEVGLDGKENNRKRQLNVLREMYLQEWITESEYETAKNQEMVFKNGIDDEDKLITCENEDCGYRTLKKYLTADEDGVYYCSLCGNPTSVRTDASKTVYSYFVDTVLEDVARDMAERDGYEWNDDTAEMYKNLISRGGYHIYATIDMEVQNQLDAIYTNMDEIPTTRSGQQLQSAMVIIDNRTGDVVAMAGGVGEKIDHDGFNRATDAELQTGSSMKPLSVYAPAFEIGAISPATVVKDLPLNYDDGVFPRNDNYKYSYSRTILSAVRASVNAAAVDVLDTIGTRYSFEFARDKFRLRDLQESYISPYTGEEQTDIDYSPLGLGALSKGLSVRDMTQAYATFANEGIFREARTYTKVYDSEGNLVLDNVQETEDILSTKTINYMNYCLESAVSGGTATAAQISGHHVAGKTGSTDSWKDRWFCGFSGYYTATVWCGYDRPEQIYLTGDGSNPACRLWKKVLGPLHEGKPSIALRDYDMSTIEVCLDSGLRATDACELDVRAKSGLDRTEEANVYWEDAVRETCDKHVEVEYCTTGLGVASEYCKLFAEKQQAVIEKRALVKMTLKEIEEMKKATYNGLDKAYLRDDMIYLVSESGKDENFHGIAGNVNVGINAPYLVCPLHTQAAWEASGNEETTEETTAPTEEALG